MDRILTATTGTTIGVLRNEIDYQSFQNTTNYLMIIFFYFISNKEAIYFNSKTADKIEYGYANIQNSRTQISIGNPKGVNAGTETRPKNMVVEFIIKIF